MVEWVRRLNERVAVGLTRAFGTMVVCYAFIIYGFLPVFSMFRPYQESFLYWSNWIQLWSLPLILVGTNILGRDAEARSKTDHERLARSYEEQQQTYAQILVLMRRQEELMADMLRQDAMLAEQTALLRRSSSVQEP